MGIVLATSLLGARDPRASASTFLVVQFAVSIVSTVLGARHLGVGGEEISTRIAGAIGIGRAAGSGAVLGGYFLLAHALPLAAVFIPLGVYVALASGNRSSLLAVLVACGPFLLQVRRLPRRQIASAAVLVGFFFVAALSIDSVRNRLSDFVQTALFISDNENATRRVYLADRDVLFEKAIEIANQHPLVGAGLLAYAATSGTGYPYPHNLFLNFAAELGYGAAVAGLLILLLPAARVYSQGVLDSSFGCASLAVFYFIVSSFSGTYYDARQMWMAIVLAVAVSSQRMASSTTRLRS